jgi:N-acetylmuramoyl-L-alanine amidase
VTVFIDPGHGGPDPGALGSTSNGAALQEKTATLAVAMDTLPLLRQAGFHVALARIEDGPVARLTSGSLSGGVYTIQGEHADIAARVDCANAAGAALLLSIHFNSYDDPSVGGIETVYDDVRPFSADNLRFARLVQSSVLAEFTRKGWSVPSRDVVTDSAVGTPALTPQGAAYGHLLELGPAQPGWFDHPSQMPGALCEPLFLTDPNEADLAALPAGRQALARAFAHSIESFFAKQ